MSRFLRSAWLWLARFEYGLPVPMVSLSHAQAVFQGATEEWSPKAAVQAVEGRNKRGAYVPPQWWAEDAHRRLRADLDMIETDLRSGLEALLAAVYAWRDSEVMA